MDLCVYGFMAADRLEFFRSRAKFLPLPGINVKKLLCLCSGFGSPDIDIRTSNPVIGKFDLLSSVLERRK